MPHPVDIESRSAIRLLAGVVVAALVGVGIVDQSLGPDVPLVQHGRPAEHLQTLARALGYARQPGPTLFLVGSSVAREAFDPEQLQAELAAGGMPWPVAKFAFNRGAPVFSGAIAEQLPLAAGDVVVVQLAEDHFKHDWFHEVGNLHGHLQVLLPASRILAQSSLGLPERLEAAAAVPRNFWRWQEPARDGLEAWRRHLLEGGRRPVVPPSRARSRMRTLEREAGYVPPDPGEPLDQRWTLDLSDAQINLAALRRLREVVHARGAELVGVQVPFRPVLYGTRISHHTARMVRERLPAEVDRFVPLPAQPDDDYYDHRHPNARGRQAYTHALAAALTAGN